MSRWIAVSIIFVTICAQAGDDYRSSMAAETLCSDSWNQFIEEKIPTGDDQGHGPDVGSGGLKSVIEFKLGIRDKPGLPDRDSEAWCRYLDQILRERFAASSENNRDLSRSVMATGPSYDCDKIEANSIEELICKDNDLPALDRKLSIIYYAAANKATNEHPPVIEHGNPLLVKGHCEHIEGHPNLRSQFATSSF